MRGYDDWKLSGPPEADDVTVDVTCTYEGDDEDSLPCTFEGKVDGQVYGAELTWECPECGEEYSEDADDRFGPDPDYGRDER